ncbi:MAG: phosphoribosylaminoimidazolesuccinocarboxamide synthase [Phycisphaerales bacterium]|nr:MAG: phosphoribosylaminoimidazolesuccinocarboxamide synthase [Phycisphaerales bacterium]
MPSLHLSSPSKEADPVITTDLPLPGRRQGKIRDVYRVPASPDEPRRFLIVATDRMSAFDVVLPTAIPGKGKMLTDISTSWFEFIRWLEIIPDHFISTDPREVSALDAFDRALVSGRMMLCRAAEVVPIECVVRGYLAGSGWKEYQQNGTVCGISLPAGLKQCQKLPEPIFTPSTKAEVGHDENISFEEACKVAGREVMERLRDASLAIYKAGAEHAEKRGILLADTKFEFGFALDAEGNPTEELLLIDEILTPDSSRFWPADEYEPGRDQMSFDKQYLRNYLQELVDAGKWDKTDPGPELPENIVTNTLARYVEARNRLFG